MRSCESRGCEDLYGKVLREIRIGSSLFLIISFQLLSLIGVCCITSYKVSLLIEDRTRGALEVSFPLQLSLESTGAVRVFRSTCSTNELNERK